MQLSLDLIQPTYRNSDIDFSLAISPDLPALLVSEVQIQQVLINLIRNACEAVEGQDRKCVSLSAQLESLTSVKIGVMDTGKGMTDEQYEKLYEPFSTDKEGGLGVGLSISRSIISNHEGRLWAERNSPQGTCFYFTLPISTLD
jgi:two-component system sensor kinase FixL